MSTPERPLFVTPAQEAALIRPGGEAPVVDPGAPDRGPWPWWIGLVGVVVAFGAVLVLGVIVAIIAAAGGGVESAETLIEDNTQWFTLAQQAIWVAVVLGMAFGAVHYLRPEHLGLRGARVGRSIGIGVVMVIAFYALSYAYASIFELDADSNELRESGLGFGTSTVNDLAYVFVYTVGAPVAEELLFRGLLFRSLRDGIARRLGPRRGLWIGAIISGVIFGGIHVGGGQDAYLPMLMILGAVLALAYHWSGTLYVPIAIHAFNNAMSTGLSSEPADGSSTAVLNSNFSADWIAYLTFAGPVVALIVAWLLARFIRRFFRSERPERQVPLGQPPVAPTPTA